MAPEVSRHRRHHRERLALAPEVSEWLRRLAYAKKNTRGEHAPRVLEFQKSTNASLGLCRRSRGCGLLVIRHRFLQRDFTNDHPVAFFHVGVLHRHVRAQVFPVNRRPFGIN